MSNQINEGAARYTTNKTSSPSHEGGDLPEPLDSQERQSCPSREDGAGATCHSREGGNPLSIIDHLDLWTSTVTPKSTSGRGRGSGKSSKLELTGIKKLRELILELAVRGKLVAQNPDDEPASKLLERIEEEKAQLIKEKVIRKQKPLEAIADSQVPFAAPVGWEWVRMGAIGDWGAGATPKRGNPDYYGGTIPWFKSGELSSDFISESEETVTETALKECSLRLNKPGDVLIAMYGATIGKTAIQTVVGTTNQAVCACTPYSQISNVFLLNLLKASKNRFTGMGAGGAQPNISREKIIATVMALPPLAEQHRIVAKVDELMALCDQLEQQSEHQLTAHQQLTDTLLATLTESANTQELNDNWQRLAQHFDLLFSGPMGAWAIDRLKDTLLQLAVMGKLVPQHPDDEPASKLLERIEEEKTRLVKEGKIKKPKKLPPVSDEEKQFELPEGWEWVRFGDATVNRDAERIPLSVDERQHRRGEFDYYGASGVIDNIDDFLFEKPLLLIGEDGANLINRSTPIAFMARGKYWVNNHAHVVDGISENFLIYICMYINSISLVPYVTGTAQPKMNQAKMNTIVLAIPPLPEQHRIVAKVDELFALCDQLKERLQQASETEQHLTNAIVEQALS
tara:strand:+ start:3025 stop:4908 length:1884 start_codon:yes stop_codon:yes gene_type:complete